MKPTGNPNTLDSRQLERSPFFMRCIGGSLLAVGWVLSPLSWWNDWFINLPLAWLISSLIVKTDHQAFGYCFIVSYWLTNFVGIVAMYFGWRVFRLKKQISKKEALISFFFSLIYTGVVLIAVKLKLLKPLF